MGYRCYCCYCCWKVYQSVDDLSYECRCINDLIKCDAADECDNLIE